jgi:predicted  nucleic acid-binding Zn-ribbon protein
MKGGHFLKEPLSFLIEVQQIDSSIGRIFSKKKDLPEKLMGLNEAFTKVNTEFDENKKNIEELSSLHREREDSLKKGQELLKKTKARQFEVKTNKEYEAILKEIEVIEGKNSQVEDQIIILLDEIDRSKATFIHTEKEFRAFRIRYESDKKKIEEELGALDSELQILQQKSDQVRQKISGTLLKKYEAIKGINKGLAVVPAWKEVCQGCYMNIPPQLYNELQKTVQLITCPNCNRILYWENQNLDDH